MSRLRRSLIVAAAAALAAALSIRVPGLDAPPRRITLLDVSASHGPDPGFLFERARVRGGKGPLVVFGRSASVVHTAESDWPATLPVLAPDFTTESHFGAACRAVASLSDASGATVELLSDGAFDAAEYEAGKAVLQAAGVSLEVKPPLAQPSEGVFLEVPQVADATGNVARVLVDVVSTARSPRRVEVSAVAEGGVVWSGEVLAGGRTRLGGDVPVGPSTTSVRVAIRNQGGADLLGGALVVEVPVERAGRRLVATLGDVRIEGLTATHGFDGKRCSSWSDLATAALQADVLLIADMPILPRDFGDIEAVARAVSERGVGLVVMGGPRAFREGGYSASPLARLLPIDCGLAAKDVRVALDRSGSMDREGRWQRAIEAVEALARATSDSSTLWILPFSQEPGRAIPDQPAPASEFLARGLESLRRLVPSGGTKVVPAVIAAAKPAVPAGATALLAIVSDFDDQALDGDLAILIDDLKAKRMDVVALVLDPTPMALARAGRLASRVVPISQLDARILVENLESNGFQIGDVATKTPGGVAGPTFSARHRGSLARESRADLLSLDGAPILATAERGRGRVIALAAPSPNAAVTAEMALRAARPPDVARVRGSLEKGRLVVRLSEQAPNLVPPVVIRRADGARAIHMSQSGPKTFESASPTALEGGAYSLEDGSGAKLAFALAPTAPAEWRNPRRDWPSPPALPSPPTQSRWVWGVIGLLASAVALKSRS